MAEENKDIFSSRSMLWLTIVILPVFGIFLSVYEIFFKDEAPPPLATIIDSLQQDKERLAEIKQLKDTVAYLELDSFVLVCKSEDVKALAKNEMQHIKDRLQAKFKELLASGSLEELQEHRDLGTRVYTGRQVKKLNKAILDREKQTQNLQVQIANLNKKAEKYCKKRSVRGYKKAKKLYENFVAKNPKARKKVNKRLAKLYYLWADSEYQTYLLMHNDPKTAVNLAVFARDKMNKCLDADAEKKYAAELKPKIEELNAFITKNQK